MRNRRTAFLVGGPALLLGLVLAFALLRSGPRDGEGTDSRSVPPEAANAEGDGVPPGNSTRGKTAPPKSPPELADQIRKLASERGARAAFDRIRKLLDATATTVDERRERSYALRFLPYLSHLDPTLRAEVERFLLRMGESHDDRLVRIAAVTVLFDHPIRFKEVAPGHPVWRITTLQTFELGPDTEIDRYPLKASEETRQRALEVVRKLAVREQSPGQQSRLARILVRNPDPGNVPTLAGLASAQYDESVRYWAIVGLGKQGKVSEARRVLYSIALNDPDTNLRESALMELVDNGVVDDPVVARVANLSLEEPSSVETIGKAYAASKSPLLADLMRRGLAGESSLVRANSARAIAGTGDASFVPFLRQQLEREGDGAVRESLNKAILKLEP